MSLPNMLWFGRVEKRCGQWEKEKPGDNAGLVEVVAGAGLEPATSRL